MPVSYKDLDSVLDVLDTYTDPATATLILKDLKATPVYTLNKSFKETIDRLEWRAYQRLDDDARNKVKSRGH